MTLERLTKNFADLRLSVYSNAAVLGQANELLDSVNRQFTELHEDWVTLPEQTKTEKFNIYLQAQADFHTIGTIIIHEIDPAVETVQAAPVAQPMEAQLRFGDFGHAMASDAAEKSALIQQQGNVGDEPMQQHSPNKNTDELMANSSEQDDTSSVTSSTKRMVNTLSFAEQTELYTPIFELPKLNGLDSNTTERVIRAIQKTVAAMERKNIQLNHSVVYAIIFHIMTLVDQETRTCWKYRVMNVEPTFDFLVGFLIERKKDATSFKPQPTQEKKFRIPKSSNAKRPSPQPEASSSRSKSVGSTGSAGGKKKKPNRPVLECPMCCGNHKLCECPTFKKLSLEQREIEVTNRWLCKNCFSGEHGTTNCPQGPCKSCNARHNSLLHHR